MYNPCSKKIVFYISPCTQNSTYIDFFPNCFVVKDMNTRTSLVEGNNKRIVYQKLTPSPTTNASNQAFLITIKCMSHWHQCVGHLSLKILKNLVSSQPLLVRALLLTVVILIFVIRVINSHSNFIYFL